jgi:hypothetical protein
MKSDNYRLPSSASYLFFLYPTSDSSKEKPFMRQDVEGPAIGTPRSCSPGLSRPAIDVKSLLPESYSQHSTVCIEAQILFLFHTIDIILMISIGMPLGLFFHLSFCCQDITPTCADAIVPKN